jgi:hypothetical protein
MKKVSALSRNYGTIVTWEFDSRGDAFKGTLANGANIFVISTVPCPMCNTKDAFHANSNRRRLVLRDPRFYIMIGGVEW